MIRFWIDEWSRQFKAATWEKIKMLAEANKNIEKAVETRYKLTAEEMFRRQCQRREDYYRQQRYYQIHMEKALKEREEAKAE